MTDTLKTDFLRHVENHSMQVLLYEGVNRHIVFSRPNSSDRWFELITWKGALAIHGDMGSYVFRRTEDMFTFFRNESLVINTDYWAEKIVADSVFGNGHKERGKYTNRYKWCLYAIVWGIQSFDALMGLPGENAPTSCRIALKEAKEAWQISRATGSPKVEHQYASALLKAINGVLGE